jgi:hypothetical protein
MERRREPRLGLRCPIHFRLLEQEVEGRSVTVDVSARGTRFRTVSWPTMSPGDRLEVTLTVPSRSTAAGEEIDLVGRGQILRIDPEVGEERPSARGVAVLFDAPLSLSSIL